MAEFTPIDGGATGLLRDGLEQFRLNEQVLEREWPRLLREHFHEWVAVIDKGYFITGSTLDEVMAAIPNDQRDTAVVRFLEDPDRILIL